MNQTAPQSLLRVMTCGSVDDGKSTLLGRLLYEAGQIYDDQLDAIFKTSGPGADHAVSTAEQPDFSKLLDGLEAEREQGITIDVAHRYCTLENRAFIFADSPGHEQYTRNMVSAASTADIAIILIDARKGLLPQTHRHTVLLNLMGINQVILAVNKMDLVDYDEIVFKEIAVKYEQFIAKTSIQKLVCIPVSGLCGINVNEKSALLPWYRGPSLLECLLTLPTIQSVAIDRPVRFPVQWINRSNQDFRGYAGTLSSGTIKTGDTLMVLPTQRLVPIKQILNGTDEQTEAVAGQALTLCFTSDEDISRGDMLVASDHPALVADRFQATIIWLSDKSLFASRKYQIKLGTQTTQAMISRINYALDIDTAEHRATQRLLLNEIGVCDIATDINLIFDPFKKDPSTGRFILVDPATSNTVAAGLIDQLMRPSNHLTYQHFEIDKQARSQIKQQGPICLWFTGLSGSGKSTIANALEKRLFALGHHTYVLDGDNVRQHLNKDLGFSEADRIENVRRVAEVARLMVDAGLIVIVTLISPYAQDRASARALFDQTEFAEVFIDTPVDVCQARDPKGLYARALSGQLKNFTGVSAPYEPPLTPEVLIKTHEQTVEISVNQICALLRNLSR